MYVLTIKILFVTEKITAAAENQARCCLTCRICNVCNIKIQRYNLCLRKTRMYSPLLGSIFFIFFSRTSIFFTYKPLCYINHKRLILTQSAICAIERKQLSTQTNLCCIYIGSYILICRLVDQQIKTENSCTIYRPRYHPMNYFLP